MLSTFLRFVSAIFMSAILVGAMATGGEGEKSSQRRFIISIESKMDINAHGEKQHMAIDIQLRYNWTPNGRERVLSLESLRLKGNNDRNPVMNSFMSAEEFWVTEEGKKKTLFPDENAPDELKMLLHDSFGVALCKLQIDESGKEIKRTVVAGPGAKAVIANGMIANAVFFHPPFMRGRDEWQSEAVINMGNGGYANGKLTYKKATDDKPRQTVMVSGTLTNEGFKLPAKLPAIVKAAYVVRGEKTYDQTRQEWVSGKLLMDVSFQMSIEGKEFSTSKGTMILNFEMIDAKK